MRLNFPVMRWALALASVLSFGLITVTLAGPPLTIDDTGILQPGGLEIILAADGAKTDAIKAYDFPVLDASLGLTENIQMSVVLPMQKIDEPGEPSKTDIGYGEVSVKWRFFKNDSLELAFAPAYAVPLNDASTVRGVIEDIRILNLPLLAGWEFGDWSVMTQVAYAVSSKSGNGWDYGVAGGYQVNEKMQLLAEVYGATFSRASETDVNYNLGVDYGFTEQFHLLVSARSKLFSDLPSEERLKYGWFVGLQWFTRP